MTNTQKAIVICQNGAAFAFEMASVYRNRIIAHPVSADSKIDRRDVVRWSGFQRDDSATARDLMGLADSDYNFG